MKIIQQVKMQNPPKGTVTLETLFDDKIQLSIEDDRFSCTEIISKELLLEFLEKLR